MHARILSLMVLCAGATAVVVLGKCIPPPESDYVGGGNTDDGGASPVVVASGLSQPRYIIVSGGNVYWTADTNAGGVSVGQVDTPNSSVVLCAPYAKSGAPQHLVVDDSYVYFSEDDMGTSVILRIERDAAAGTPIVVSDDAGVDPQASVAMSISDAGSTVYWTSGNAVMVRAMGKFPATGVQVAQFPTDASPPNGGRLTLASIPGGSVIVVSDATPVVWGVDNASASVTPWPPVHGSGLTVATASTGPIIYAGGMADAGLAVWEIAQATPLATPNGGRFLDMTTSGPCAWWSQADAGSVSQYCGGDASSTLPIASALTSNVTGVSFDAQHLCWTSVAIGQPSDTGGEIVCVVPANQ